jgi:ABC-type molybdate transport system substrate-binding protein
MRQDPLQASTRRTLWPELATSRRRLLGAAPALAALTMARPARAEVTIRDLALACDVTLGAAMRAAGAAYADVSGVRVAVFAMDCGLILPQLERQVQNDIVVTRRSVMAAAVQADVVAQDAVRGAWQNPIVIATRRDPPATKDKPIAVCDLTPASDMNGPDILARLGLPAAKSIGVIDTDTVVDLVLDGSASAGLMHMTDLRAHPELQLRSVIPAAVQAPIAYAVAVTKLARRPDPGRFVEFLLARQATVLLASLGLELAS